MKKILVLLGLIIGNQLFAQNKYALVVGINRYIKPDTTKLLGRPNGISNLKGSINDAKGIIQNLILRYDFKNENILFLFDSSASRENILNEITVLKNKCKKGDFAFFYYSGHGSNTYNKKSTEPDKMDETIVPADGVFAHRDIRDKEFAKLFEEFNQKGITLTAVFDACHSGSITRGLGEEQAKMVKSSTDVIDDGETVVNPSKNGALIISSAQDFQVSGANKFGDEYFSYFTKSLLNVLAKNKIETSSEDLMNAVKAQMRYWGFKQIPTMEGLENRLKQNWLGMPISRENELHVAVEKDLPGNRFLIQGGTAIGLNVGTELSSMNNAVKLEIVESDGIDKSIAKIVSGDSKEIKFGKILRITKQAYNLKQGLKVGFAVINCSEGVLENLVQKINNVIIEKKLTLLNDITKQTDNTIFYQDKWILQTSTSKIYLSPNLDDLSKYISTSTSLKLQLPMSIKIFQQMNQKITNQYTSILKTEIQNADYFVAGSILNGQLNYALQKRIIDTSKTAEYPNGTAWYKNDESLCNKLCDAMWKTGKIKSWLTLTNEGSSKKGFPYELFLQKVDDKNLLQDATVKRGEQYKMVLLRNARKDSIHQKWVYVFVVSSDGGITLLFPQTKDNSENHLPVHPQQMMEEIYASPIEVGPPYGIDHVLMLSTDEPLSDPHLIEQEGYATRGLNGSPLESLIGQMNAQTRSVEVVKTPANWSLQKIRFTSVDK